MHSSMQALTIFFCNSAESFLICFFSALSICFQAVKSAGKQIDKAEKKQIKKDSAELQKKIAKMKVDKVTEEQLNELRQSKAQLEASSADLRNRFNGGDSNQ